MNLLKDIKVQNYDNYKIYENEYLKLMRSKEYNYNFNKINGVFMSWGENLKLDSEYCIFGPNILDMEWSTICHGIGNPNKYDIKDPYNTCTPCSFCYKSNTGCGKNMSLDTYKKILSKLPKTICQIAGGIGDIDSNPDLWNILEYTRSQGIVPNITINGWNLTDEYAEKLAKLCGAISVSKYSPKDVCYNAIEKLSKFKNKDGYTLKQINIHQLIAHETIKGCIEVIDDKMNDERLKGLNSIVFLTLKEKGNRNTMHVPTPEDYKTVIEHAIKSNVSIGSDSCGSGILYQVYKELGLEEQVKDCIISCESFGIESAYINVDGRFYPCSFAEGVGEWKDGIDVLNCDDFIKDVWYNPLLNKYRKLSIKTKDCNGCRKCLVYSNVNICDRLNEGNKDEM